MKIDTSLKEIKTHYALMLELMLCYIFPCPQNKNNIIIYDRTTQTHLLKVFISIIYYFGKNGTARSYISGARCDTERTGCEAWI